MKLFNGGKALPAEVRVDIYNKVLKEYEYYYKDWDNDGFCFVCKPYVVSALDTYRNVYIDDHKYLLPELYDFRTFKTNEEACVEGMSGYWYRNNLERIEALKKAILKVAYSPQ